MAHLIQVGAGSGGMAALDLLGRDPRIGRVTLIEPDVYKAHNVERHLFGPSATGRLKAELAAEWLKERRPDLEVVLLPCDLTDPAMQGAVEQAAAGADIGVCAADNEAAKYHWDALMRKHGKPWIHIPSVVHEPAGMVLEFVRENGIKALNVAGSLESKEPGIYEFVKRTLEQVVFTAPETGTCLGGPGEG